MGDFLREAMAPSIVRRALTYAAVVGTVLIAINHGDAILSDGDVTPLRLLRMGLTLMVPYLVSTFSSVSALREARRAQPELERQGPASGRSR